MIDLSIIYYLIYPYLSWLYDTDSSKEKEEFQSSILEDLKKISIQPDLVTFTSDYLPTMHGYALYMILTCLH